MLKSDDLGKPRSLHQLLCRYRVTIDINISDFDSHESASIADLRHRVLFQMLTRVAPISSDYDKKRSLAVNYVTICVLIGLQFECDDRSLHHSRQ